MSEVDVLSEDEVEEVDALPVVAAEASAETPRRGRSGVVVRTPGQVAAQAAAVAVAGFAAGAIVTAVARHARSARVRPRRRDLARGVEVVGTRTFLVDVHLLGGRE